MPGAVQPDAGLVPREVDVKKVNGGYVVDDAATAAGLSGADAGVAAPPPQLTPPQLLADSPATYPASLRAEAPAGEVKLELLIDESGAVSSASVLEGSLPDFNAAALQAASGLKFKPALLGDKPVPVRLAFSYLFQAPKSAGESRKAPAGRIKGLVRSKGNRRPLPGGALTFDNLDVEGSARTIEMDPSGHFQVELPPGAFEVKISAPGYKPGSFHEQVVADETLDVIYALEPLVVNPYETVVRGDHERTEVARVTLHDQELREVPGTMGDPFRVVMLLPGVSSVASGVGYPVVRGSLPASTGYFIDNIRVPILFHLFLGPAVVHPDFLETIDFYPGAPPPQYGRLTGGVIDGKISRAHDDRVHGTAYVDLINAGGFVEVPIAQTGTSVTLAGRLSYTPWLVGLISNAALGDSGTKAVLDFYDYQGRVEQKVGPGTLRLFAFGSSDVVGVKGTSEGGLTALTSIVFHRLDLRYTQPLGVGEVQAGVTIGKDRLGLELGTGAVPLEGVTLPATSIAFSLEDTSYKAQVNWHGKVASSVKLLAGADVDHRVAQISLVGDLPGPGADPNSPPTSIHFDVQQPVAVATMVGGWIQAIWEPSSQWKLVPGLRVDNYHLVPGVDFPALEPRFTAFYQLSDELLFKAAAGLYHQPPTTLISIPAVDLSGLRFGLQRVIQTDVGVEWKALNGLEVSSNVYWNLLQRTLEVPLPAKISLPGSDGGQVLPSDDEILKNESRGYAYGFELLIRHPLGGNWFGWLSYTLQRSVRYKTFTRSNEFGEPVGTASGYVPFTYDQSHVLNAVLSYKFEGGWTVGGAFHLNTGLPEAGDTTSLTSFPGVDRNGDPSWIPADLDKVNRLPPFARIDLRVSKAWVFDEFSVEAYLDVMNATLSTEVLSYVYGSQNGSLVKTAQGIPFFLPTLGVKATY